MKVYLHSIGCRLNQSEIETMGRQLLAAGHEVVNEAETADTVIINTCAVTGMVPAGMKMSVPSARAICCG